MIQFVREVPISIQSEKALPSRRGFLFHVAAGFSGPVDPQSGMIVNLVVVDAWLAELRAHWEEGRFPLSESLPTMADFFAEVFALSAAFLKAKALRQHVELCSLAFREERGFGFASATSPVSSAEHLEIYHTHHLELVSATPPGLYRVRAFWKYNKTTQADTATETLRRLKSLGALKAEALISQLQDWKNSRSSAGSDLLRLELTDLATDSTLEIF